MAVNLSADEFCRAGVGEIAGVNFPALQAKFSMMRFDACRIDMASVFPLAGDQWTCWELFGVYNASKYTFYQSPEFLNHLDNFSGADYDSVYVLGGAHNYWHYLVDFIANFPLVKYFSGPIPPVLVGQDLSSDYISLIEPLCSFLGVEAPKIVPAQKQLLQLTNSFVPCVNELRARVLFLRHFGRSIQGQASERGPEKIFFRRGSVNQRRILNEEALEERLANEFGFVAVDPGAMSVIDQIKMMRNAKIIIGGHGAALTNLCFAADGPSFVFELFVNQPQMFFHKACEHLGVAHTFIAGDAAEFDVTNRADNVDYTVDIREILKRISAVAGAD